MEFHPSFPKIQVAVEESDIVTQIVSRETKRRKPLERGATFTAVEN